MLAISLENPFGLDTYSDLSIIVGYPRAFHGYKGDLRQVSRAYFTYLNRYLIAVVGASSGVPPDNVPKPR